MDISWQPLYMLAVSLGMLHQFMFALEIIVKVACDHGNYSGYDSKIHIY